MFVAEIRERNGEKEYLYFSNAKTAYKVVTSERRYRMRTPQEVPGVTVWNDDPIQPVFSLPCGYDTPLVEAEPSIRMYHILTRRAQALGLPWKELTIGHIFDMATRGDLNPRRLPSAGRQFYDEVAKLIYKYVGFNYEGVNPFIKRSIK